MALEEHLRDCGAASEVAVDLKRRVGAEEVGVGAAVVAVDGCGFDQLKQVAEEAQGVVPVAEAGLEVDFPCDGPAGAFVAAALQSLARGRGEVGSSSRRDLVAGMKGEKMRAVAVLGIQFFVVLGPFQKPSVFSYGHPGQPEPSGFHFVGKFAVAFEGGSGIACGAEKQVEDLAVHAASCTQHACFPVGEPVGIFRRSGGTDDEAAFVVLDEEVEVEAAGFHEDGINALQEGAVAAVIVTVPEMEGEPAASHEPVGCGEVAVGRTGVGPDVGVVVGDEPPAPIHDPRGFFARFDEAFDQVEEGFVALGEVGDFGRPVIHFRVDVDGVFGTPCWLEVLVPDALEIRGEATGAAARDEQVAPEVKIQRGEPRIVRASVESLETFVGRDRGCFVTAELQPAAVEEGVVIGDVVFQQAAPALLHCGGGMFRRVCFGVGLAESGGGGKDEGDGVGVLDDKGFSDGAEGAAFCRGAEAEGEAHAVFAAGAAPGQQAVAVHAPHSVCVAR